LAVGRAISFWLGQQKIKKHGHKLAYLKYENNFICCSRPWPREAFAKIISRQEFVVIAPSQAICHVTKAEREREGERRRG